MSTRTRQNSNEKRSIWPLNVTSYTNGIMVMRFFPGATKGSVDNTAALRAEHKRQHEENELLKKQPPTSRE